VSVFLPDVNVLIALAWPNHVHHEPAVAWFRAASKGPLATCPITENGFVRVSSNPAAIRDAVSPQEAVKVLDAWLSMAHHVFWSDGPRVRDALAAITAVGGYRQVTDSYLLYLALVNKGTLVTLDSRIRALVPDHASDSLFVIDA